MMRMGALKRQLPQATELCETSGKGTTLFTYRANVWAGREFYLRWSPPHLICLGFEVTKTRSDVRWSSCSDDSLR